MGLYKKSVNPIPPSTCKSWGLSSYEDIGATLGISKAMAHKIALRAMRKIRARMPELGELLIAVDEIRTRVEAWKDYQ